MTVTGENVVILTVERLQSLVENMNKDTGNKGMNKHPALPLVLYLENMDFMVEW